MRIEPKDKLTDDFYKAVYQYIKETLNVESLNYAVYDCWNKNKRTLFHLLGDKLKVKIPFDLKVNRGLMIQQYEEVLYYRAYGWYDFLEYYSGNEDKAISFTNNREFGKLFYYLKNDNNITEEDFKCFWWLFDTWCIIKNYYVGEPHTFSNGLTIHSGEKVNKFINRYLHKINYPRIDKFNRFFLERINCIRQKKVIHTNLVISIDPLDFMTMSDNDCNWTSCMNWHHYGSYSAGTIEMMNSNCVMVAYLEPEKNKMYHINDIDNKMQRFLVVCNKDIVVTGKVYPGFSDTNRELQIATLDLIMKLAKKNLNWSYQYKYENYYDMLAYYFNNYVRKSKYTKWQHLSKLNHHTILIYSNMMYNDFVADHDEDYMCCRNYVKKPKRINISGPATCMKCGKRLDTTNRSIKLCKDCEEW